jgi:hypothetical protein
MFDLHKGCEDFLLICPSAGLLHPDAVLTLYQSGTPHTVSICCLSTSCSTNENKQSCKHTHD